MEASSVPKIVDTTKLGPLLTTTAPLSKTLVEKLISDRSPLVTFIRKGKDDDSSRSAVWGKFTVVCIEGRPQDFVCCDDCTSVLSWITGSTTAATRHLSTCRGRLTGKSTGQQMTLDQFQKKVVPDFAVKDLNRAITIGLAKDLKPLGMIKGPGFQYIAQQLINFGAKFQFQKAENVLSHPTTLKRNLPGIVKTEQDKIMSSLKTAPSFPNFAFTTDMWTDGCQQRHFLSLCVHYIDQEFSLKTHMLAVDEFPEKEKSTVNIRMEVERILANYFGNDVPKVMASSTAVTDGGSNFLHVFPRRVPCMCHKLNLVMHWTFNDKIPTMDGIREVPAKKRFVLTGACPEIKRTLEGLKNLVRFFKKSGLNYRLSHTLKQENDTRWNSKLRMLESYWKSNADIKRILVEKNQVVKLADIKDSAVNDLISFLKPFEDCTDAWSYEKKATIHTVVLEINKIRTHLAIKPSDSSEIQNLKSQAIICFNEYMDVEDIFYAACMLDPRYKKLKFLDDDSRRRAVHYLRAKTDEVISPSVTPENTSEPPIKHGKYDEFQDSSDDEEIISKHEIDKYLECKVGNKDESFKILDYWKQNLSVPKLRKVALEILSIPASQTSDERVFSSTGATLSPRRTELKGTTLSNLTFIHKNFSI